MSESCVSLITLKGDPARVSALKSFVAPKERPERLCTECFSLHEITPMPNCIQAVGSNIVVEAIEQVSSGTPVDKVIRLDPAALKTLSYEEFHDVILALKNIREFGRASWYDWSLQHWGTKWDAYDTKLVGDNAIRIHTVDNAPYPAFEKLSRLFPEVTLEIKIASSTRRTPQYLRYMSGERVSLQHFDPNSEEGIRFSCEVLAKDFYGEVKAMRDDILNICRSLHKYNESYAH